MNLEIDRFEPRIVEDEIEMLKTESGFWINVIDYRKLLFKYNSVFSWISNRYETSEESWEVQEAYEKGSRKRQKVFILPTTPFLPMGRKYLAVSESYEILASHFCSNDDFAISDLGSQKRIRFYQSVHPERLEPKFEFVSDSHFESYKEIFSKVMNKALESMEERASNV